MADAMMMISMAWYSRNSIINFIKNKERDMKSQLSLNELAQKLTDQKSLKKDYIVESDNVRFYSNGSNQLHLQEIDEVFDVNDVALNQITTKVGIV
jgi:hypothetical protein